MENIIIDWLAPLHQQQLCAWLQFACRTEMLILACNE